MDTAHWNSRLPVWKMRPCFKWELRRSNSENSGVAEGGSLGMLVPRCLERLPKGRAFSRSKCVGRTSNESLGELRHLVGEKWRVDVGPDLSGVLLIHLQEPGCWRKTVVGSIHVRDFSMVIPEGFYHDKKDTWEEFSSLTILHTTTEQFIDTWNTSCVWVQPESKSGLAPYPSPSDSWRNCLEAVPGLHKAPSSFVGPFFIPHADSD